MISRTVLRLPSPRATSLLHHLTRLPQPSSLSPKPSFLPNNGATFTFTTTTTSSAAIDTSAVSEDGRKFPRPSTITWSPRLQNSVSLIGAVEYPLKQYNLSNGKFGVYTLLRVKTTPDSNSFFSITVAMWDELAERAMLHLKQNDFIYISGELGSYAHSSLEGIETVRYKVTAKEFNYVELDKPGTNFNKVVKTGENFGESPLQKSRNRLHLWQVFFANPAEWYDNRKNKKNPKAPDFKHKSTGEAIWINATDPPWVKNQLELLDSRRSGGSDRDINSKFSHSLVSDEQLIVPSPTVEELNYINLDEGGINSHRIVNIGNGTGKNIEEPGLQKRTNRLQLLKELFASPDEWDDLRKSKKSQREPDFKHKSTGEELWLNASDPPWVDKELVLLEAGRSKRPKNADEQLIVPSPSVTTQRAVNSGNATGKSSLQKKNERLELLQNLFANPEKWFDNRNNKKNPKQPDFKHKNSGEAIWLNEADPAWVKEQVGKLDSRSGGPKKAVVS